MRSVDLTDPTFKYSDDDPDRFRSGFFRTGPQLGAAETGVTVYELPPGQAVCPYHYEYADEEWAMPLDGPVTVRDPEGEHTLAPMHLVFFPKGPDGAHLIRNDGDAPVRVLMFGQNAAISLTCYPDSDKLGMFDSATGEGARFVRSSAVPYFHGEVPSQE